MKVLKVTGGKERIRYFIDTCLPNFVKRATIRTSSRSAYRETATIPHAPHGLIRCVRHQTAHHRCLSQRITLAIAPPLAGEVSALLGVELASTGRLFDVMDAETS